MVWTRRRIAPPFMEATDRCESWFRINKYSRELSRGSWRRGNFRALGGPPLEKTPAWIASHQSYKQTLSPILATQRGQRISTSRTSREKYSRSQQGCVQQTRLKGGRGWENCGTGRPLFDRYIDEGVVPIVGPRISQCFNK